MIPLYFPWEIRTASLAGAVKDTNAIKASIATDDTDPAVYVDTDLDGVLAGGPYSLTRNVSVTTSASAATYNTTDPIVFTGTDLYGIPQTEELTLTDAGGGETIVGTKAFLSITQIDVPVQDDTTGAFEFGVQDAFLNDLIVEIRAGSTGDLKITHTNGSVDTIPVITAGEKFYLSPIKVWGDSTTVTDLIFFIKI